MRYALILVLLAVSVLVQDCKHFSFLPKQRRARKENDQACYLNGTLTASERRSKVPFAHSASIYVLSFSKYYEMGIIKSDSTLRRDLILEKIKLSEEQVDSITEVFYNYNYSLKTKNYIPENYACYEPRHAIVFMNSKGKVENYIKLCFNCARFDSNLPKAVWGNFCTGKYELLQQRFAAAGITYFGPAEPAKKW